MLSNPLFYLAVASACALGRKLVTAAFDFLTVVFVLNKTGDPEGLRRLADLERARRLKVAEVAPDPLSVRPADTHLP